LVKIFVPITALGMGGRQFVSNFENTVPVVTFAIFIRHYLRGTLRKPDKLLVAGYAIVSVIAGISSGWLGSAVNLGLVFIVVYVYEKRRFPMAACLAVLPVLLFFQPAKTMFRERYWARQSTDSSTERVTYWVENSWRLWNAAITSHDNEQLRELSNSTLSRFDLLRQTAHVIEFTPSRVPYQYGNLYSYMLVTFIPRYFWPDKPSVNDANRWYQVQYGLTDRQNLSVVSIAVGSAAPALAPALVRRALVVSAPAACARPVRATATTRTSARAASSAAPKWARSSVSPPRRMSACLRIAPTACRTARRPAWTAAERTAAPASVPASVRWAARRTASAAGARLVRATATRRPSVSPA
jgi:hypothetical protein